MKLLAGISDAVQRALIVFCACLTAMTGIWLCPARAADTIPRQADTAKKCAICHFRWVAAFFLEHRSTPLAAYEQATDDAVGRPEMCLSCHDGSVRDSRDKICNDPGHRIGVTPSSRVTIPEKFPLDAQGRLQCTTCHTPHAVPQQEGHLVDFFLRAPNPDSSFCNLCHSEHSGGIGTRNHPVGVTVSKISIRIQQAGGKLGGEQKDRIICETCHIAHGGVNSSFLVLPAEETKTLSILCEVCHTKQPGKGMAAGAGFSHPVDVLPGSAAQIPATWHTGDPVVRGTGAELVCRTCHRPHHARSSRALLCAPGEKDALCVHCHLAQAQVSNTGHDLSRSPLVDKQRAGLCSPCHAVHEAPAQRYLWAAPAGKPFVSVRDQTNESAASLVMVSLCTGCHAGSGMAHSRVPRDGLHPAAFFRQIALNPQISKNPAVFLYDPTGVRSAHGGIVCSTCHTAHAQHQTPAGKFLRPDVPRQLCSACHGSEALVKYLRFHRREEHKKPVVWFEQ